MFKYLIIAILFIITSAPAQNVDKKKTEMHDVDGKNETLKNEITRIHKSMEGKIYNNIWNKECPVLGFKVDNKIKPIIYNNKNYGFCCKVCVEKFRKEPGKYALNLTDDGTRNKNNNK